MKVKIEDVIDALEFVCCCTNYYYNPSCEEILAINDDEVKYFSDNDLKNKYIILPTNYEINKYTMKEFIKNLDNNIIKEKLYSVISRDDNFINFKKTCEEEKIINEYYKFRDNSYKEIAIDWCKRNNIDYE